MSNRPQNLSNRPHSPPKNYLKTKESAARICPEFPYYNINKVVLLPGARISRILPGVALDSWHLQTLDKFRTRLTQTGAILGSDFYFELAAATPDKKKKRKKPVGRFWASCWVSWGPTNLNLNPPQSDSDWWRFQVQICWGWINTFLGSVFEC